MCPQGIPLSRASAGKGLGGGAMGSRDLERALSLDWGYEASDPLLLSVWSPVWMHGGAPGMAGVSPGV